jgi:hypothetical protein
MPSGDVSPAAFDYCPFCGMHLPRTGFDAHLDEYDDCAERRRTSGDADDGWGALGDADSDWRPTHLVRTATLAAIVLAILAYSLFVAQELLLGVLASGIVVAGFLFGSRS